MKKVAIAMQAALAAVLFGSVSVAVAADPVGDLKRISGTTLVDKGEARITAREGSTVEPGDRVMAVEGDVVVHFFDGCDFLLEEGKVLTVPETSTCAAGGAEITGIDGPGAAIGSGAVAAGQVPGWVAPVVIGGGFVIIAANNDGDDRDPISQ